ncbi:hypothetical protein [Marinobacter lutaoensis]|uniref:hypothetical protein n=1 Tax=Marinobacter lutaoensis TaxID=135739 RepID=UPI001592B437|nr:hypothetical protein [Marinobacter lutaoensis]NVD34535.1 hypothetical protein [Marinobacter lutaoensis]
MKYLVASVAIILFCIPKINLISIGNYNAGIRVDDFLVALFAIIYIGDRFIKRSSKISQAEAWFLVYLLVVTISVIANGFIFGRGSMLFPLRFFEYFVFLYIGFIYSAYSLSLEKILKVLFLSNVITAYLQAAGVIGGFTVYGYRPDVSGRVIGLTGGPWELGALMNFLSCYYLINSKSTAGKYAAIGVAMSVILLTGSRMSFLAEVLVILAYTISVSGVKKALKRVLFILPVIFISVYSFEESVVAKRSESLLTIENVSAIQEYYDSVIVHNGIPSWDEIGKVSREDIDASWGMRVLKWIFAVKLFFTSIGYVLFGVGAGAYGNALDGGWLRILTESGTIGFYAFLQFFLSVRKISPTFKLICLAFAVNMLMIDIYMSYKVMALFLFLAGIYIKQNALDQSTIRLLNQKNNLALT